MAPANRPLLRLRTAEGWCVEMDSSTSVEQWRKASGLGVLSGQARWMLRLDRKAGNEAPGVRVLDVQAPVDGLAELQPHAEANGCWSWESSPLFFDNGMVQVEIELPEGASDARVFHLSKTVCDRFVSKNGRAGIRLVGLLEFGNDLGDFELAWEWQQGGARRRASIRTTVFSTKLDLQSDFPRMLEEVRSRFGGILRIDLLKQTQWNLLSSTSAPTLQSWLTVFRRLESDLVLAYRRLLERHRQRLRPEEEWTRAERIRHVAPQREEEFARRMSERPGMLFRSERQVLDPDRIENRFAKHVLAEVVRELGRVRCALDGREEVSEVFKDWLREREDDWKGIARHPFWRGVGHFRGFRQESLALQRDPVYARIFEGWGVLRKGLSLVLSDRFQGGLQSVDDLYEVWCLVRLDGILRDLGWSCGENVRWDRGNSGWDDLGRKGGNVAARLAYVHPDRQGESVDLLYQPSASSEASKSSGWEGMLSLPVPQRPDIVLRHHAGKATRTWIFDAKYRVESGRSGRTAAPPDAIDQMHRYRDALLWTEETIDPEKRLRESIGAYALFPGTLDGWEDHPQAESVEKVNIGAFPLKPGNDEETRRLKVFVEGKLSPAFLAGGCDPATPLAKGTMPIPREAFVFFGLTKRKQDGMFLDRGRETYLYHVPVEQILRVENAGHDRRNWTHVAPRRSANGNEVHGVYRIRFRSNVLTREDVRERYAALGLAACGPDAHGRWTRYILFELDPPAQEIELGPLRGPQGSFGVIFWSSVPAERN